MTASGTVFLVILFIVEWRVIEMAKNFCNAATNRRSRTEQGMDVDVKKERDRIAALDAPSPSTVPLWRSIAHHMFIVSCYYLPPGVLFHTHISPRDEKSGIGEKSGMHTIRLFFNLGSNSFNHRLATKHTMGPCTLNIYSRSHKSRTKMCHQFTTQLARASVHDGCCKKSGIPDFSSLGDICKMLR